MGVGKKGVILVGGIVEGVGVGGVIVECVIIAIRVLSVSYNDMSVRRVPPIPTGGSV